MQDIEDFSSWWSQILKSAEIVDVRYPVKGLCVWYPFGFAIRNLVYSLLRSILDEEHQEVQFPLLIPADVFSKEKEHIKGFEDEVYWVTHGGKEKLDVPLAIRPTSETAIYPIFKIWIRSHADLPIRIYQIVNVFRHETKHTRPLIRVREITSFKEAHTAHLTWEDADEQVKKAIHLYHRFFERLGVPHLVSRRPEWDKFPGADYSIAFDTILPDGKTLQIGTIHHLGTNFAETYDIKYEDVEGKQRYVNQTCYGISERCIAALLSIHGNSHGLVLPPELAPIQVVVIPIIFGDDTLVCEVASEVCEKLKRAKLRVVLDDSEERPGAKFYKWEMKGIPVRIEIGPRDLREDTITIVRRDNLERLKFPRKDAVRETKRIFKLIHKSMKEKAEKKLSERIKRCETMEEAKEKLSDGIAVLEWCGSESCGKMVEEKTDGSILGEILERRKGRCVVCRKPADKSFYLGRAY